MNRAERRWSKSNPEQFAEGVRRVCQRGWREPWCPPWWPPAWQWAFAAGVSVEEKRLRGRETACAGVDRGRPRVDVLARVLG